jgi:hypothetical protein
MDGAVYSDDYVVRIYRYRTRRSPRLVGTVEKVGMKEKKAFTTMEELWIILMRPKRERKKGE